MAGLTFQHPPPSQFLIGLQLCGIDILPWGIADNPLKTTVAAFGVPGGCVVKSVGAMNVLSSQRRQLEPGFSQVRWIDVFKKGQRETELSDLARIFVDIHTKDAICQNPAKFCRPKAPS